jgi:hypothetical protein
LTALFTHLEVYLEGITTTLVTARTAKPQSFGNRNLHSPNSADQHIHPALSASVAEMLATMSLARDTRMHFSAVVA